MCNFYHLNWTVLLELFITLLIGGKGSGTRNGATLQSSPSILIENGTFTMTCVTNVSFVLWIRNEDATDTASLDYKDGTCIARSFIANNPKFNYSCNGEGKFTLVLIKVQRDQHGEVWNCKPLVLGEDSNKVTVNVTVPVVNAWIQSDGKNTSLIIVQENSSKQVACVTSYSRPRSNISWYISDTSTNQQYALTGSTSEYKPNNSITSSITLNLNRTYNGWNLVCQAENIPGYTAVTTSATLNITYSTSKPVIQCTNDGVYKVVENSKGNVTCTVDGGNPAGRLHWNCTGDISEQREDGNIVSATLVWTASQYQYCSCTATNMAGNRSTSIKVDVLYPPVIRELKNTSVFGGDSVTLQCVVIGSNPPVNRIQWISTKHTVNSSTLYLPNISRTEDRVYTCTAYNTMDPSCRDVVPGQATRSLHLDVLYAPSVIFTSGTTFTVNEGDRFSYNCLFVPGNPSDTTVVWKTPNNTKTWTSSELVLQNVTRYGDSVYTCYARNTMINSNGITRIGNDSADIRLIVHFIASVSEFYLQGYQHSTNVTVSENDDLIFVCVIQSNPKADVKIHEMDTIVNSSISNKLFYRTKSVCSGEPVHYACHGNNSLNRKPSVRQIELRIRCKPRKDASGVVQFHVAGAINETVTLSYTALAYPPPTFVWYRKDTILPSYRPRTFVSSSTLQTNLTITQITEDDYGEYFLNVTNDVGSITEIFYLKAQGVPETPSSLTQDNTSTTDSIISLYWKSGFNNGLEQTFNITYRQQNTDKWQSVNVPDTGSKTIHYNITGLSSDTTYEIVLFAFNDMGRSKSNVTLICRTKERLQEPVASANSMTATAVGVSLSVVVLFAVAVSVVVVRRRRRKNIEDEVSSPVTYQNMKLTPRQQHSEISGNETSDIPDLHTSATAETIQAYDRLSPSRGNDSEYMKLGNPPERANQTYDRLAPGRENDSEYMKLESPQEKDTTGVYENLKIELRL